MNSQDSLTKPLGVASLSEKIYRTLLISALIVSSVFVAGSWLIADGHTQLSQVTLAIAGSLFGTAVFSVWMMLSRAAEQTSALAREEALFSRLDKLEDLLVQYRAASERLSLVRIGLNAPFVLTKYPTEDIARLIRVPNDRVLNIWFLGIDIKKIYLDHLVLLRGRPNTFLKIVLPDPKSEGFKAICHRERRIPSDMKRDIEAMTSALSNRDEFPNAEVKWTREPPPVTIVQVDDTIFWRPQLLQEQEDQDLFCGLLMELEHREMFRIVKREVQRNWNEATAPPLPAMNDKGIPR